MLEDHHQLLAEYSAVQQALSELAAIYNDAPIGMAVIGTDSRFQRINARLAEMNGAPVEAHIGRTIREVVPALADIAEGLVRKIAKTRESILNLEVDGETAAEPGVIRSFIEHWSPVFGSDGAVVAVNIVVEEVTAQKRAAEALRASEARLREVLEAIKEAFVVLDHDFRIIQANREALRIDGRSAAEIVGRIHWDVWPASLGTPVETAYRRVMSERVPMTLEHHYVSGDHDLWLNISAYPTSDGIALFYRDITERKRAEERLRQSERRLSTALRAGQLGVFEYTYHPSPSYYWDRTVRQIWGVGPHDVITNDFVWSTVHPDDEPRVRHIFARSEDPAGSRRYDVEYRIFRRGDNALRWVKVASDMIFEGNDPVRLIGTIQDITDRKQTEEQALLLIREVNHRSKNLLAVVQSIAHQMARSADPETFASGFAERLAGLASCQDLLVGSHWQGVDLAALIAGQLAHYKHLIGTRIHLAGEPLRISANTAQSLGMALHELATNAAKYGALSAAGGEVRIGWAASAADDAFNISWTERGGPPVAVPDHRGLGSQIITRLLERSIGGSVVLDFDPSGLRWSARAKASAVLEAKRLEAAAKD